MRGGDRTIAVEAAGPGVTLLRLDRPEVANALNTRMGLDLLEFFDGLNADPAAARAVVVTGAGARAFCAGGDLKQRNGMTDAEWQDQHLVFERMVRAWRACPIPVIAAVNGAAFGGGCEMVLLSDFAYAAETARFALTEVTLGIMPGAGGTQLLPRAVGAARAREILLTGRPFGAAEAMEWGVVNAVFPAETLLDRALDTARAIAANAPLSTRQIKQAVNVGLQMDVASALMFEIEAYNRLVPTEDRREGVRAFNEKRRPDFKGH